MRHIHSQPSKPGEARYLDLVGNEPFRMLFPVGLLLAIIGISLWPLYFGHVWTSYPGIPHARIMFEGFLAAFVFGFLGTALPRMLSTPRLTLVEVLIAALLLCGATASHLFWTTAAGDLLFVALILYTIGLFAVRAVFRRDLPPPGFVMVAMGMVCGIVGATALAVSSVTPLSEFWQRLAILFLYQGFILFPMMGIGAFLFPRFFGLKNRQDFEESLTPPRSWTARARFALFCGLAVVASFFLEAAGFVRVGNLVRFIGFAVYLLREVPLYRTWEKGTMALCLRIALFCAGLAFVAEALFPAYRIGFEHILYMGGFSLVTLTVASRVVLGHSGFSHLFTKRQWPLLVMMGCILIAMTSRVVGDLMPRIQTSHYIYAAILWVFGAVVWDVRILSKVTHPDPEDMAPTPAFPACSHAARKSGAAATPQGESPNEKEGD